VPAAIREQFRAFAPRVPEIRQRRATSGIIVVSDRLFVSVIRVVRRILFMGVALAMLPCPAAGDDVKSVSAHFTTSAISLDGVLSEPAWSEAVPGTAFVQREPRTGQPASQRTEFRVVYTQTTLYIGLSAFDREPSGIIQKEMQRDQPLWRDDAIDVLLDTFHDHRNAYLFETNSNGARTDALITDEGRDFNLSWNGVWEVASRRSAQGWFAELAIPFSTLRFDPASTVWGINVLRYIRRNAEQAFWAPILLDADVKRVSKYGELTGIRDAQQGWGLNVKPFIVGSNNNFATVAGGAAPPTDGVDYGLDAKWAPTRGVAVDVTVNTDFGETEADDLQTNFTRFSLFQPEKREFFLENAGIFEFGPGAPGAGMLTVMSVGALSFGSSGSTGSAPLLKLFHSRRIGIDPSGGKVPIDVGVRSTGRIGDWNLGVLEVGTAAKDVIGSSSFVPRTNFATARMSRNLGARSSVGMIYTDRDGGGVHNRAYGADMHLRPVQSLAIDGYAARTDTDGSNDWSSGLITTWNRTVWHAQGGWVHIGQDFDPEMGFLLRTGINRYNGRVTAEPWVKSAGILNLHFEVDSAVYAGLDGRTETEEYRADLFGLRTSAGHEAKAFVTQTYDAPRAPFAIAPGVSVPVGEYRFNASGFSFLTHSSRPVSVEGQFLTGGFYDGNRTSGNVTLRLRPNRFVRSETTTELTDVTLAAGSFVSRVYRERLAMAVTPKILANLLAQYNDLSGVASVNLRFNWNYRPGSDLFVVYNETTKGAGTDLSRKDRQIMIKVTFLYQR
jgi:hypothetical protein